MRQPTSQEARECSAGPCNSCFHFHANGGACNPGMSEEDAQLADYEARIEARIADSENQEMAEE